MGRADVVLTTVRLVLREFQPADAGNLFAIIGDPETMRYYPAPYTRERTRDWITDSIERYGRDGFGLWVIEDRETGQFLGSCGPALRVVDGVDEVELGWHVKRASWGQGIASEAAAACREHAFGSLGLDRLISLIRPENLASRRVAEKIGMAIEKKTLYGSMNWLHLVYSVGRL